MRELSWSIAKDGSKFDRNEISAELPEGCWSECAGSEAERCRSEDRRRDS